MFWLLLKSDCTTLRLCLYPSEKPVGWKWARTWKRIQLEQLTWIDWRDIPYYIKTWNENWGINRNWGRGRRWWWHFGFKGGRCSEPGARLGIGLLMRGGEWLQHLFFFSFIHLLYMNPWVLLLLLFLFSPRSCRVEDWMSACVSTWLLARVNSQFQTMWLYSQNIIWKFWSSLTSLNRPLTWLNNSTDWIGDTGLISSKFQEDLKLNI